MLKETPGYDLQYKDVIKEGLVYEHSGGRTTSLSEMYTKYPREYSLMIEAMKGTPEQRKNRYEDSADLARKRVIAAICQWVDKLGYTFESQEAKVRYVIGIACRAANCGNFNAIPESRLSAIYNLYCKRNSVDINGNPELDFPVLPQLVSMARYIPLQDKLDEIEEQGKRLRRRLDYLSGERDFLVDTLLTRPTRDMEAQRRLLREWDEEIDRLEQSIAYLRREYVKYKEIQNKQMCNNQKQQKNGRFK